MKSKSDLADAVLEPELRELVFDQDAARRAKTAEKFMRWANQLTESVMISDPALIPQLPPPKVPRGFFLLCLAKWEQDELRDLARKCGLDLRSVIGYAIRQSKLDLLELERLKRQTGMEPHTALMMASGGNWNRMN